MACPYFMPTHPAEPQWWTHPRRLPLGGGWSGHCTAPGHEGVSPGAEQLKDGCNLGYARHCPRLPRERAWDAVRFAPARASSGRTVLVYVCERQHRPGEHGTLEFDAAAGRWTRTHPDPRIQKMAQCFLQSCLQPGAGQI